MKKSFDNFSALKAELDRREAIALAEEQRRAKVQAEMDAMWEARNRKVEADRKAQSAKAWYLYR